MSDKSICLVSAQYLPHVGGVENFVYNLSGELVSRGYSVTVVTSGYGDLAYHESDERGVEIYRLPSWSLMNGRFPVIKSGKKTRAIKKELMSKHFDIMLVNTRFYFLSLFAVKLAKKMSVRSVILDHGSAHINTGGRLTSAIGEIFEHWITWREKHYCKEFAGCSRAVLKWIEHFKIYSDTVLYNSIDAERFIEFRENPVRNFREELGIPKGDTVISFVGRLTYEKGLDLLVEAVKKINSERGDVWLLIAGEGYLREKLEPEKSKNTLFLGRLSTPEVGALLAGSDILCLPSVATEGFPTCILEGAVCGCFVITTSGGGAKELISDGDYGIVISEPTSDKLYSAICGVLDKTDYRKECVTRCYDRVVNNYTWKHTADEFLKLTERKGD